MLLQIFDQWLAAGELSVWKEEKGMFEQAAQW